MSTDYGFLCNDCKEAYIVDENTSPEHVRDVITIAPKLAALRQGTENLEVSIEVYMGYCGESRLELSWFEKHGTHKLSVIDEYGYDCPRCEKTFMVSGPNGEQWKRHCHLKENHPEEQCSEVGGLYHR